ncbi:MAG: DNA methyltransferase [Saprospiraceae bacterium]|nr:site-specific DNA-methyltransferase [Saprospiraceae bacterium]MDW8230750.1 DNA methyltransferase [Saprospiraceae bacterium]
MQTELFPAVERRSDYTFQYNAQLGRHGWLRLTPAYSVKLVRELIKRDCTPGDVILDPFSGTATTGLVAAEMGLEAILLDINPFLVWLGHTKCYPFAAAELEVLRNQFQYCASEIVLSESCWRPLIHNIERWWHPETLCILSSIRQRLAEHFGEPGSNPYHNLIWIAFLRLAIETSSAAFNHVSMSFKDGSVPYSYTYIRQLFEAIVRYILHSAHSPLPGKATLLKADARDLTFLHKHLINRVITSPPYPNRISYIRELRPYMYWSKFLCNGGDAGALDWEAIGGTWGTATSNLKHWRPANLILPERLYEVCYQIAQSGDKHSRLMSLYVHKYFDDMYTHLASLRALLKPAATLSYIVGNSCFYGHFVETDKILMDTLLHLGYQNIRCEVIRRRNSKRGLLEFKVQAQWNA